MTAKQQLKGVRWRAPRFPYEFLSFWLPFSLSRHESEHWLATGRVVSCLRLRCCVHGLAAVPLWSVALGQANSSVLALVVPLWFLLPTSHRQAFFLHQQHQLYPWTSAWFQSLSFRTAWAHLRTICNCQSWVHRSCLSISLGQRGTRHSL